MIRKLLTKLGLVKKPKPKPLQCSICQKEIRLSKDKPPEIGISNELGIDGKCLTYYTCKECDKKERQAKLNKIYHSKFKGKKCGICQNKFTEKDVIEENNFVLGISITCGENSKYEERFSHKSCQRRN